MQSKSRMPCSWFRKCSRRLVDYILSYYDITRGVQNWCWLDFSSIFPRQVWYYLLFFNFGFKLRPYDTQATLRIIFHTSATPIGACVAEKYVRNLWKRHPPFKVGMRHRGKLSSSNALNRRMGEYLQFATPSKDYVSDCDWRNNISQRSENCCK